MADVHSKERRSRNMAAVRSENTKPEILIRRGLHARGLRFRLHQKTLPGTPDLVFPKYQAVIFVHGCFWHRHECHLFKWPETRPEYWHPKLNRNAELDRNHIKALHDLGWRVLVVWECAITGPGRFDSDELFEKAQDWLVHGTSSSEIAGRLN